VTPEASAYLGKANQCLAYARTNLAANLGNDAGRNAYLAMFHAAQALIYERSGKAARTHQGVHTEFNRVAKAESFDRELGRALPRIYNLKAVADYETGPDAVIPLERASSAVDVAARFVARVVERL
jgi:uncharacterized protein (UPF0332 family)